MERLIGLCGLSSCCKLVATPGDAHEPLAVDDGRIDAQAYLAISRAAPRVQPAQHAEAVEEVVVARLGLHGCRLDAGRSRFVALISSAA